MTESESCKYVETILPPLLVNLGSLGISFDSKLYCIVAVGEILMNAGAACAKFIDRISQVLEQA